MQILALDLGRVTGWAKGATNSVPPASGSVELAKATQSPSVALAELQEWFSERSNWAIAFSERSDWRIDLVVKEAPLSLKACARLGTSEDAVRAAYGQHAIIEALCEHWGLRCIEVPVVTVTKHFTGKSAWGGRAERKRAILARARALGYIERNCRDEDRADALAIWDWAQAVYGKARPKELKLYGEA